MTSLIKFILVTVACFTLNASIFAQLEADAFYRIESRLGNNLVIDLANSNPNANANIVAYPKNGPKGTKNQIWRAIPISNGYYVFETGIKWGMVMDVKGGGTQNQTNIQLYPKHDGANQQFRLIPTSDGYFKMESRLGAQKNVDVYGGQPTPNSNISIHHDNGHKAQQFRFVKVNPNELENGGGNNDQVTGRNVKFVIYGNPGNKLGSFMQKDAKTWKKTDKNNKANYFTEMNRDDWSVYLHDKARNIHIQIDLHTKKVYYTKGQGQRKVIAQILSSKAN